MAIWVLGLISSVKDIRESGDSIFNSRKYTATTRWGQITASTLRGDSKETLPRCVWNTAV